MFHTLIRKIRDVGSIPAPASKNKAEVVKYRPPLIPPMYGGLVVPEFDISITHCGYCNRELIWQAEKRGHKTWEAYDKEREQFESGKWPQFAWGPPCVVFTYGCPKYGNDVAGPMGWHYHWWSENFILNRETGLPESGDSLKR